MPKPNIIYIHSHDTGRYVQPYGHAVPTPNMQRLAEQGVLFRQAFTANPTCSPSRAALVTGQFPHQNGMLGLVNRGCQLNDYSKHIVTTLKHAGYTTALSGIQHVAPRPDEQTGFDQILPTKSRKAADVADAAIEFLENRPDGPFYLTIGSFETHRKFPEAGPDEDARYCLPPAPFPDTPETRQDMAEYKTMARHLDEGWGKVFCALDDLGLAENTLVVCTTDHGLAFPHMKCNLFDHGIGVLLILRGPSGFNGGKVIDSLVSQVDIFPTLCDVAGIDPPNWLEGKSILPLVTGEADRINEEIFAEVNFHACYDPQRCVRTERYKYIRRFDGRTRPPLPNCDGSMTKDFWLRHGWKDFQFQEEQLYDLVFDSNESNNLAGEPRLAAVLEDLRGRLHRWMKATDDPLLAGPIPPYPGAELNGPDQLQPGDPTHKAP